jgi:hypothetical protein
MMRAGAEVLLAPFPYRDLAPGGPLTDDPERQLSLGRVEPTFQRCSSASPSHTTWGILSPYLLGIREVHRSRGSTTCESTSMIGVRSRVGVIAVVLLRRVGSLHVMAV